MNKPRQGIPAAAARGASWARLATAMAPLDEAAGQIDNPLFRYERQHWRAMRPMSRRLLWLTAFLVVVVTVWIRRVEGDVLATNWYPVYWAPPRFPELTGLVRHWLAEPRWLLGLIAGMWCIEDAWRQRASGLLDQLVLTRLSGAEILAAKVGSLARWAVAPLAAATALIMLDLGLLTLLGHYEGSFVLGVAQVALAPARALELWLFFGLAAVVAWRAILHLDDHVAMLRHVVAVAFGLAAAAHLFHIALAFACGWIADYLAQGWFSGGEFRADIFATILCETLFLLALCLAWSALVARLFAPLAENFHALYTRSPFGEDEGA